MPLSVFAFSASLNSRLHKILVAAKFANVAIETPAFTIGVDNETEDWMMNCHPLGRTPVLQTDEGYLFESNAIMRYIGRIDASNTFIYGRTNFEASQIDSWIDYASCELDGPAGCFLPTAVFGAPRDEKKDAENLEKALNACDGIDRWMENRTFLVGERLSIADITIAFSLNWVLRLNPNPEAFKKYKNMWRLYNTVMNQPKTVEVLRSVGAEIGFTAMFEKKAEKPAKVEKPKAAEKAPKKPEPEEEEEEEVQAPKKPNPLDLLPPSTFVIDAFKREYSNNDTRKVAAPYLQANFDPAGWCAYWCKYKYNSDLTKQFMTGNLIRGWFQRMEHCRKWAFGSVLIVGTESNHEIVGLWIFRGDKIPQIVEEVEDTCLFDWTPADFKAEWSKIVDYLAHEGPSFPQEPLEGRVYK